MYVLDRLWRGEITPSEKYMRQGSEYREIMLHLCRIGDQISEELSQKGNELFQEYMDTQLKLQSIESRETFIDGFRLGAGLLLDVVTEYKGEFQYPAEE